MQGPTALAVGAGGLFGHFFLSSISSILSPSIWETARYRLKYGLKGLLSPKQPTNQILPVVGYVLFYEFVSKKNFQAVKHYGFRHF